MKTKIVLFFLLVMFNSSQVLSKPIPIEGDTVSNTNEGGNVQKRVGKDSHVIGIWNAQMLIGNGFNYDRGLGFGVRGNFEFSTKTFAGVSIFYHMGFSRSISVKGHGPSVFWGPEIGQRIDLSMFKIELGCSLGELTYEEPPEYTPHFAQGTVSKFFFAPGIGVTTRTETGSVGIHLRYVVVENYNMLGAYFSVGI